MNFSRRARIAAAAAGTAVILAGGGVAYALTSGPGTPPLSKACRAAQQHEMAVAGLTRQAGQGTDMGLYLMYQKEEGRALHAMQGAGCPPGTKVAGPY